MEEKFNEAVIKRINAIKVPVDLDGYECPSIPLGKSVYIQEMLNGERKTQGGLIIAESKQTQGTVGRIVGVGPRCEPYLRVGLKVLYSAYANLEIIIEGQPYLVIDDLMIYGIIPEESSASMDPPSKKQIRGDIKRKEQVEVFKRVRAKEKNDEDEYEEKVKKNIKKSPRKRSTK